MSDIENCFKCGQTPDDILMLKCNHDLCLYCAAQSYSHQSKQYNNNKNNLTCEICSTATELDGSSIGELQNIYQTMSDEQKKKYPQNYSPVNQQKSTKKSLPRTNERTHHKHTKQLNSLDNITSTFQLSTILTDKENNNKDRSPYNEFASRPSHRNLSRESLVDAHKISSDFCQEHPDEDLYYFCFTCLCPCVCPECVIHGMHRDHDVKTIKKSFPLVKQHLENTIDLNSQILHTVQGYKEEIDKRNSQQNQVIAKFRYQIQQEFEILHQVLSEQEKQLIDSLSTIPSVLERYEGFTQHCKQIDQHIRSLNSTIQKQFTSKEETKLLNFYSEFSKVTLPKLESLPNYNEPQTNQGDILESLTYVRKCVEAIEYKIYTQSSHKMHRASEDYMNDTKADKKLLY